MERSHLVAWVVFAVMTAIWGSTFLAIRIGNDEGYPPVTGAATRLLLAAVGLALLAPILRVRWPRGSRQWLVVASYGVLMFAINFGLLYWGETMIPSATAAVLWGAYPVIVALAAAGLLAGTEPLRVRTMAGGILGFVGIAVVFWSQLRLDVPGVGMLAVVGGILSVTGATIILKRWGTDVDPIALNASGSAVGAAVLLPTALLAGETVALPATGAGWGALLYLTVAGSMGAFVMWSWLLKKWPATKLSFGALLSPLLAVVLGAVVLGEAITVTFFLGTALVVTGTALAVLKPRAPPPARVPRPVEIGEAK